MGQEWSEITWKAVKRISTLKPIVVQTFKYDGVKHRRWPARVIAFEAPLIVLEGSFEEDVEHDLLGSIAAGTLSTEFYWLDRWYNVFCFWSPDNRLKCFYCNINAPPTFDGDILSYIDLDIDVLVQPDLSYQVLDLEEFENHSRLYSYPDDVRKNAYKAVEELISLIEARDFPFRAAS